MAAVVNTVAFFILFNAYILIKKQLEISFLFLVLLAEIIGTIGGFGSSVFFVPITAIYFNFQTILGITAVFHVASNLSKVALFKKGIDKMLLINLGIPAILFVILGGIFSKYLQTEILELVLGAFLIVLSAVFLIFRKLAIQKAEKKLL